MNKMQLFFIFWLAGLAACTPIPENVTRVKECAPIYPDYTDITIPYNIAPLNFRIDVPAENAMRRSRVASRGCLSITERIRSVLSPRIGNGLPVRIKVKPFFVTITTKEGDGWTKWAPFSVYISDQAIDSHLVYRLIEPGYEKWHIVGIYQRNFGVVWRTADYP